MSKWKKVRLMDCAVMEAKKWGNGIYSTRFYFKGDDGAIFNGPPVTEDKFELFFEVDNEEKEKKRKTRTANTKK